jgi:hypothetical protein
MIDSPGLIETNHQLVLSLVSGQARTSRRDWEHRGQDHARRRARAHRRHRHRGNSVMPVYTVVTANAKPAVLLNVFRQPASNTVQVANAVHAEIDRT